MSFLCLTPMAENLRDWDSVVYSTMPSTSQMFSKCLLVLFIMIASLSLGNVVGARVTMIKQPSVLKNMQPNMEY